MINEIRADVKISFKQMTKSGDVFYTFQYGESRQINNENNENIEEEKEKLWNDVTNEVNKKIIETKNLYKTN